LYIVFVYEYAGRIAHDTIKTLCCHTSLFHAIY